MSDNISQLAPETAAEATSGEFNGHVQDLSGSNGQQATPPTTVTRKQNVACDACRAKKVRCQRTTTTEKCAQCVSKGVDCTSHYIEQLQNKTKKVRRKAPASDEDGVRKRARESDASVLFDDPAMLLQEVSMATLQSTLADTNGETSWAGRERVSRTLHLQPSERKDDLIRYLFSPTAITHWDYGYSDLSDMEQCGSGFTDLWEEDTGKVWGEEPSQTHSTLSEAGARELAEELIEAFFSVAHPRFPAFDPAQIKARLSSPDTHPDGPVEHPLIALAIAFGARFSDHPAIEADRAEMTARDQREFGEGVKPPRSRLVQMLVVRAREVIEAHKCHRIRKPLNVLLLLLTESLMGQAPTLGDKYLPYHFHAAVKHIIVLGYNDPDRLMAIKDEKERASAVYAWWQVCLYDGFRAAFHRLPSALNEINYETPDVPHEVLRGATDGSEAGDQAVVWFSAAASSSAICRDLSRNLWSSRTMKEGIPLAWLRSFVERMRDWKDKYLSSLGVPEKVPDSWDFISAITATSSDSYHHTLWLVVERAIKDFGIYEVKLQEKGRSETIDGDYESVRREIGDQADYSANRITRLINVLRSNSYLRLDPLVLAHPICEAGWYLSIRGRPETRDCIDGLKQYAIAYPSYWDTAVEMERTYNLAMQSVVQGSQDQVGGTA